MGRYSRLGRLVVAHSKCSETVQAADSDRQHPQRGLLLRLLSPSSRRATCHVRVKLDARIDGWLRLDGLHRKRLDMEDVDGDLSSTQAKPCSAFDS